MQKEFFPKIFLSLLFFSIITTGGYTQNGKMSDHWAAYLNYQKHQSGELNDSALHFLHKAENLAFDKESYNRYLWYINEEARYLYIKSEPYRAIDVIKEGMQRHKAHEDTLNSFTYAYSNGSIGFILYSMGKNEEALKYFLQKVRHEEIIMEKNLPYYQKYPDRFHNELSTSYETLTTCYQTIYEKTLRPEAFFHATEYAEKLWKHCMSKNLESQYGDALYTYGRLASVLFPNEALDLLEISSQYLGDSHLEAYYSNLSDYYLKKGNPDKAKALLKEGLEIIFKPREITSRDKISTGGESPESIINQLAGIYLYTNQPDSAIRLITPNLKNTEDPVDLCETYALLAKARMNKGNLEKADSLYKLSRSYISHLDEGGTELELLNDMALLMLKWNKTDTARHYTSLADSIARSYEKDFFKSPHANNIQFVLNHIFKSARIFSDLYLREHKIEDYQQAQKLFLEGLKLTNRLNFNLIDKSSLAYLSNNIKTYLPWYFDINYARYKNTGDEKYATLIGDALANNKARTLTTLIRREENQKLTIFDGETQKVDSLEFLINDLESAILSTNDTAVIDSLKIKRIETAIDLLGYKFREERKKTAHYPDYAENTLKNIQKKLDANSIFVDYYLSDSVMYTTYVTSKDIDVKRQIFPDGFPKAVRDKQRSLKTGNGKSNYDNMLWSTLLTPLNSELKNKKHIIIVPDSYLYKIPFETLFKNDQFLIESHTINYNYSALAYLLTGKDARPENLSSLILAPDFSNGNAAPNLAFRGIENDSTLFRNGKLVSLPFAQSEAKEIFEKFRKKDVASNLLTGPLATKENFIKYAENSHILHMATHGYSSRENPFRSCIFFSDRQNHEADYMMMNELYNLSLDADLAVLSACQTGNGQIIEGEGMLALPGGFIFSGVPNVIASLWKVHDQKTRFLMEAFYSYLLEEDKSYKEALRLAKLNCIKEGYLPLDWAGFVLIGE
ncbi:CHAT domain-containing protein [Marinilabilia rubra]|uniref:CHAT domain-containing protein n=1 Tax=Marinilabilia rubra TaxID=2162893 RepID=A0A2U2BCS4_9BACT|nr:CHAT domain-containing tetratricopeptide repeat protein [Marinilabilia rubra]PWE00861.1 hypothetical protein DDZ16_04535 [Marinilabilia rubra]